MDMEQQRLTNREARLVAKFARLEKTLALLQNQKTSAMNLFKILLARHHRLAQFFSKIAMRCR